MKSIIVIGHKNPDTDSIVASLVFIDYLKKLRKPLLGFLNFRAMVARCGDLNRETEFVLNYFKQSSPALVKNIKNKNVVLVDHGEYEQAADGVSEAEIIGVLDHHKLGGLKTAAPVFYRVEPLGSTSTLIAKMFLENNLYFDKKTAGLLLAAILSDTLKFTSPTTTDEDKKIANILSKISRENINKLSQKMFEAKSDISGISIKEIISQDYKEYKVNKITFGFGVWETTNPKSVKEKEKEILVALRNFKNDRKTDLMFFALVDILKKNSEVFILGEKEKKIAEKVFKNKAKKNILFLRGVVSRKKQMLPDLMKFLEKNEVINK